MSKYQIIATKEFERSIVEIENAGETVIIKKRESYFYPQLSENPYLPKHVKKLKNWVPISWRLRIGNWRFIFQVNESSKEIFMMAASQRKDVYR